MAQQGVAVTTLANPRLGRESDNNAINIRRTSFMGCILHYRDAYTFDTGRLRYKSMRLRRMALLITDTELKLMAAAAIIGDSSRPKKGYSTPAAIGTPSTL